MTDPVIEPCSYTDVLAYRHAAAKERVSLSQNKTPTHWFRILVGDCVYGIAGLMVQANGTARIRGVYMLPAFRGRGYGDQLTRFLLGYARSLGCSTVDAFALNPGWYLRNGFKIVGKNSFEVPRVLRSL